MFHQFVRFCFPRVGLNPSNPGLQCSFPLLFLTWFHQYERGAGKPHESWLLGHQNLTELGYHMTSDCMQMQGRMCNVHKLDYACCSCFPDFSLSLLHFCQILENFFFILVLLLGVPFLPNILVYMMKPIILFLYTIFWSLNFYVEKILLCSVSHIIKVEYCLSNENIHLLFIYCVQGLTLFFIQVLPLSMEIDLFSLELSGLFIIFSTKFSNGWS